MRKLELHLAKLPLDSEIKTFKLGENVFLCSIDMDNDNSLGTEIYVSEHLYLIRSFIDNAFEEVGYLFNHIKVHIHEYETYEDAYKVAFDIRETNPKCYN